jgi:hypothetical protein
MQQPWVPQPLARTRDELLAPYVTILAVGSISLLLLVLGLSNLIEASMPWAHTGLRASVTGVYPYDSSRSQVSGQVNTSYEHGQPFAAVVNWAALPKGLTVGAAWYAPPLDTEVGRIGPETAGDLATSRALVPMTATDASKGVYRLLVMHYVDNQPVEILAHQRVEVT